MKIKFAIVLFLQVCTFCNAQTWTNFNTSNSGLLIRDISGRELKREYLPNGTVFIKLGISELAAGIYFVTLETESGRVTKKFIKE